MTTIHKRYDRWLTNADNAVSSSLVSTIDSLTAVSSSLDTTISECEPIRTALSRSMALNWHSSPAANPTGSMWTADATYGTPTQQFVDAGAAKVWFELDFPHGVTVNELKTFVKGAAGHSGLPAVMPTVGIYRRSPSQSNSTILGSTTDASSTTTYYQTVHSISVPISPAATLINTNYRYFMYVSAESGANALTGLTVNSIVGTWTAP